MYVYEERQSSFLEALCCSTFLSAVHKGSVALWLHQFLVVVMFSNLLILMGIQWNLNVVLICICLISRNITLPTLFSQSYGFSSSHVWMWELDHKEGWALKNWCFQIVVLEKTLESPFDCKEVTWINPKGNQPWIFIGWTDAEAPILWPPDAKSQLIGKDPDAGKDWGQEEKRETEDEVVGWHHLLSGHELEQTGKPDGLQSTGLQSWTWQRLNNSG